MNSEQILQKYTAHPAISDLVSFFSEEKPKLLHLKGLAGSSPALVLSAAFTAHPQSLLVVLNDYEEAAYFFDDIRQLTPNHDVLFFPSSFKRVARSGKVSQENIVKRIEVLNRISEPSPCILITHPEALIEKVVSNESLASNTLRISNSEKVSLDFINDVLFEYGFERVDFVYEPGQYSVRGGIIDIFSFAHDEPFRIDFFGDEVESIRSFDIDSQLSIKKFDHISIIPNIQTGIENEARVGFLEYLPKNYKLAFRDFGFTLEQIDSFYATNKHIKPDERIFEQEQLCERQVFEEQASAFGFLEFGMRSHIETSKTIPFITAPQPEFNKNFELLAADLKQNAENGYENYILSGNEKQIERLEAIFSDRSLNVKFAPLPFTINEGFIDRDLQLVLYTDHQIFERYHRYKLQTPNHAKEAITLKELNKLHSGDYVVHIDHGIGKFAGLVKTEVNGKVQEAIRLVYRDNDSLLVNIHSLHRISKYKGKDGTEPNLNKLGTSAWQKMKKKAKSKVKDIAKELIALYAERLKEKGFAYSNDSFMQQELEASFMYEDTPDQFKSTQAIKEDMEKLMPMDRLVCGDVGFGKTEVAIRAAFKAATDNKQVAVLVPTTILALQHYKTFTDRLKDYPVKIGYISRLRKTSEVKDTLKELKEGKIDIVIGTHRLVGKDVKFKDLGLLIIDEEQKFGVSVKEKLKRIKINVDTLTLTATPIPRTLQFSLMGARDLSIIQTPPPNRYPIVTEVHGFNEKVIKEAIDYEIDRGGQIFFINNRVQNIYEVEAFIKKACPYARTAVGHGQMEGPKLEKIMLDFINGEHDVLIATTIIESGLDIPNANTIIINNAQNFGLSDLHQLRGRVGRSNKKAFCYLLAPPMSSLTQEARRRLKAIEEFSELGSGFNIAMRDLDIRGAGNMLGGEQSGYIADIGYETYHRILNEAVQELKQDEFKDVFAEREKDAANKAFLNLKFINDCNIETDMEIRFPENYVNSIAERMALYRDLDNIEEETDLEKFKNSLTDRFGEIPQPAIDLIEIVRLRWLAIQLGMERVILKNGKMICHFIGEQESLFYKSPVFMEILQWVQHNPGKSRIKEGKSKLSMTFDKVKNIEKAYVILHEIYLATSAANINVKTEQTTKQ
ncbi:MAG: transcription-repair coupling factor [Prolixibacteraceae bacterium]|jgi:transcription-repair coupling factor (superfamily II helicase)|nr:transcription-repair coupling factor [Prolixibacteraceae bacterium]